MCPPPPMIFVPGIQHFPSRSIRIHPSSLSHHSLSFSPSTLPSIDPRSRNRKHPHPTKTQSTNPQPPPPSQTMADPNLLGIVLPAIFTPLFVFFAAFILVFKCTNWRPRCFRKRKNNESILPGPSGPRVDPPFFTPPYPYPLVPRSHPQPAPAPRPAPARIAPGRVDHVYRSPPSNVIPARKAVPSSNGSSGAPGPSSSGSSAAPVEDSPYAPYPVSPMSPVSPVSEGARSPGVVSPVRMEFEDVPLDSPQPGANPKGYWGF